MFACDLECTNWNELGISAHSVAVTELGGKLSDFVGNVLKANKTPMISKFVEATMPKDRGMKRVEKLKTKSPSCCGQVVT